MPEVPAVPHARTLTTRVADVFADNGPLARSDDAFEARPGQRELAARVADTFENGGILIAEAGTGTGKTLAYLVPAVLSGPVSYTPLRAHETVPDLVCRLLLENQTVPSYLFDLLREHT